MLSVWEDFWDAQGQCPLKREREARRLARRLVKKQAGALEAGAVNEEAKNVISELDISLTEQPVSAAKLLDQPVRLGDTVITGAGGAGTEARE